MPPHIRAQESVPKKMWITALALLPAAGFAVVSSGFPAFRVLVTALASALLTEVLLRKLFRKEPRLGDGSTVIAALLFGLLLPPNLPSWIAAAGSVFALAVGREIFGGLGQNPFNPALVGRAFLLLSFPLSMRGEIPLAESALYAVAAGGVILLLARVIHWEVPFLYFVSVWFFNVALGGETAGARFIAPLQSGTVLLAGFFLVTDPVTTPLARAGERAFVLGAGFLTAALGQRLGWAGGVTYGILAMNAVTPWIDRWFRPKRGTR